MGGLNGVPKRGQAGLLSECGGSVDESSCMHTPHWRASPLPHLDLHVFRWNCTLALALAFDLGRYPKSIGGLRGTPSRKRGAEVLGQEPFAYFWALSKSEWLYKRNPEVAVDRSNGYAHQPRAFSPSGLPLPPISRYTRRLSKVRQRSVARHGNQPDPEHHQGPDRALRDYSGVSLTTIESMSV